MTRSRFSKWGHCRVGARRARNTRETFDLETEAIGRKVQRVRVGGDEGCNRASVSSSCFYVVVGNVRIWCLMVPLWTSSPPPKRLRQARGQSTPPSIQGCIRGRIPQLQSFKSHEYCAFPAKNVSSESKTAGFSRWRIFLDSGLIPTWRRRPRWFSHAPGASDPLSSGRHAGVAPEERTRRAHVVVPKRVLHCPRRRAPLSRSLRPGETEHRCAVRHQWRWRRACPARDRAPRRRGHVLRAHTTRAGDEGASGRAILSKFRTDSLARTCLYTLSAFLWGTLTAWGTYGDANSARALTRWEYQRRGDGCWMIRMSPYNLFGLIFMSFPSALQDNFTAIWDADVIARTVLPYVAESAITTVSICTPLRPHLSILL